VVENRVLRRIFVPKRDGVARDWRRLHNELHNLFASPNIVRMIKSRRMRWAEHVAGVGGLRNAYEILAGNLKGKDYSQELVFDGRISEYVKDIRWGISRLA
jgi:hypothetical protein